MPAQLPSFDNLVEQLSRLPTIGKKTARRMALYLLRAPLSEVEGLAKSMVMARRKVGFCSVCGSLAESDPCGICSDPGRDRSLLLVVEEPGAVFAVERSGRFNGLYHVLMGTLGTLDKQGGGEQRLKKLVDRVKKGGFKEVILATNPSVEGETTAEYIRQVLKGTRVKITRIARGLPAGGDLELADEVTLADSLEGRREMQG